MDRVRRQMTLPTFLTPDAFAVGETVTLGEDEAHHIRVRRLALGEEVGLLDGRGARGTGVLVRLAKRHAAVSVRTCESLPATPSVHLILPVAERDRMLWLAEKATELCATSWRPVLWKHSRSVTPRGEGPVFQQKVAARMAAALEQSRGAWLPVVYPDATPERAITATPPGPRLVLDIRGEPIATVMARALEQTGTFGTERMDPVTIAIGPAGGFDEREFSILEEAGFCAASLGGTILRFETAAVAALAVVRAGIAARTVPHQRLHGEVQGG